MPVDVAKKYADVIREAILSGKSFEGEKHEGFFLSKNRGFEDKLYVGNIHRIENHLFWNDEELQDDDQVINVVVIDGPVTRDGDGCSYGSKDHRDQILYANTIPQVVGHLFIINTPGGAASSRIDYEQAIADCREKGKPTVAWVDGLCCSAGQLVASLCDRTVVMNGRDTMGCIGTMCAFWGVPNGAVDQDGYRYIELVSVTTPDKNAEYREASDGKTEKLQEELNILGEEFRETVRQNRPLVKEEHLTGKTFDAQDVMGALVDEIGDYTRALEAVFELADGTLPAARTVVEGAAQEPATSQNPNDMPEEKKKAAEAVAAQAAAQEASDAAAQAAVQEETTAEAPIEGTDATAAEGQETAAEVQEETTAEEEVAATEDPETAADEETAAEEPEETADEEPETTVEDPEETTAEDPETVAADEETTVEDPEETADEEEVAAAGEDIAAGDEQPAEHAAVLEELRSTLETMTAERDSAITDKVALQDKLDAANGIVAERDKKIAELQSAVDKLTSEVAEQKKQLASKDAEIKELAKQPTPMVTSESGVPADNGTGSAPAVNAHQRIKRGMTYSEIRALQK